MFLVRCEARCDESLAFPSPLRPVVLKVVSSVNIGEWHPPRDTFAADIEGELIQIPYRVYYNPQLLRSQLKTLQATPRLILLCLGTRHYDGYLRQECLRKLMNTEVTWVMPYLIQLAGEYVHEIVQDVLDDIIKRKADDLRNFAMNNTEYLAILKNRVRSYWDCYYRQAYPELKFYPGEMVIAILQAAVE